MDDFKTKILSKFTNVEVKFFDVSDFENRLRESGYDVNREIGLATYIRLFIADYIGEEVDKVLYLDCDILVDSDLNSLFSIDMQNNVVAAVKSTIDLVRDASPSEDHVNAGVLLFNLPLMRKENFTQKFINVISAHKGRLPWHDGTVINEACKGRIHYLPLRYNAVTPIFYMSYSRYRNFYDLPARIYSAKEYGEARNSPAIIHLTNWVVGRPWTEENASIFVEKYFTIEHLLSPNTMKPKISIFNLAYLKRRLMVSYHCWVPMWMVRIVRKSK